MCRLMCVCACIYVCMYVCMYIYVCVCIYTGKKGICYSQHGGICLETHRYAGACMDIRAGDTEEWKEYVRECRAFSTLQSGELYKAVTKYVFDCIE